MLEAVMDFARPALRSVTYEVEGETSADMPFAHASETGSILARLIPQHRLAESPGPASEGKLSLVEAAVLLASAWLHEIGLREDLRREAYNVYSARSVWDGEIGASTVPRLDPMLARAIAEVCLAHRDYRHSSGDLVRTLRTLQDKPAQHWKNAVIKLPLLAALLRMAVRLETQYHRRSDLGDSVDEKLRDAWLKQAPIGGIEINSDSGLLTVKPTPGCESSPLLQEVVELWCAAFNREFETEITPILSGFHLPYRPLQPSAWQRNTSRPSESGALALFEEHAQKVLEKPQEYGVWRRKDVGATPVLERAMLDSTGTWVTLEILASGAYPQAAPRVRSVPRIKDPWFDEAGTYDGAMVRRWPAVPEAEALGQLCEELRRFEDPHGTFRCHAQFGRRRHAGWELRDSPAEGPVLARRITLQAASIEVLLTPGAAYPQAPPRFSTASPDDLVSRKLGWNSEALTTVWENFLRSGGLAQDPRSLERNPLELLLQWMNEKINSLSESPI